MNKITNEPIDEIIIFFIKNWKKIIAGGFIGGTLGVAYALITPPTYQATAYIGGAKIGNADVENPLILLEKIKIPSYLSQNTVTECKIFPDKINITILKNSSIIKIQHVSKSPDDAKRCLENILIDIRIRQGEIYRSTLTFKMNRLNYLKNKLKSTQQFLKVLFEENNFDVLDQKSSNISFF